MTWGTLFAGVLGGAVGTIGTLGVVVGLALAGKHWLQRRARRGRAGG